MIPTFQTTKDEATFEFNLGLLKTAKITADNRLFINDSERTDWRQENDNYAKPENHLRQKEHLQTPFLTGESTEPVLTASRGLDGRIFLRLYRNGGDLKTFRGKVDWVGSYWEGRVLSK